MVMLMMAMVIVSFVVLISVRRAPVLTRADVFGERTHTHSGTERQQTAALFSKCVCVIAAPLARAERAQFKPRTFLHTEKAPKLNFFESERNSNYMCGRKQQ